MKARDLFVLKSENVRGEIKTGRQDEDVIYIKSRTKTYGVEIDTILYIESVGNYVNLILTDKKIITYLSMQNVLDLLPPDMFCRIHKSYVISLKHVDFIEKHRVIIKNKSIPIGNTYREHFSGIIKKDGNIERFKL